MASVPLQNVSPGHPRFVAGFVLTGNQVNADGTTSPVLDTTTALVVTTSRSEIVASVDPANNRRVVISASSNLTPGSPAVSGIVTVDTSPPLPTGKNVVISVQVSSATDQRSLSWDPLTGGTTGDA
ncbi:MAG TPA: hypothetical protein VFT22_07255 [Kofleriaceae bacterium]|nr:hypothetical protein [Kofleriaceae bacterium]